jgi:Phosphodiester glycosidase
MPNIRRSRLIRTAIAAVAACALATIGAVTTGSNDPASALQACPAATGPVQSWVSIFASRGVRMCRGIGVGGNTVGYLQIVSMGDGAKVRVQSSVAAGQAPPAPDTLFTKRDVGQWDAWITANDPTINPSRLFSETNASYFINTSSPTTTQLSLPERRSWATTSNGWALTHHSDPAWNVPKKVFIIDTPNVTPQFVNIQDFPTHYTAADVSSAFNTWQDGLVAFRTDTGANVSDTRTFLAISPPPSGPGFPLQSVYILTVSGMNLTQAQAVLNSAGVFGVDFSIQLDGGGSTGMHSDVANFGPGGPGGRKVPDVVAVYLAP